VIFLTLIFLDGKFHVKMGAKSLSIPSRQTLLPYLALGAGILALGFSAIFVRWANAPGPVMGLYRIGLSTIFLAPFFFRRSKTNGRINRQVLVFPLLGGILTAFDMAVWNTSVNFTSAANATLLGNTAPLWVALAAWFIWRERLRSGFWLGLTLTMIGATTVLGSDFLRHPTLGLGDLLAILAGIFYAGYFLVTQRGRAHLDTLTYVWLVGLSSSLTLLGMSLVMGLPVTGYSTQTYLAFIGAALVSQTSGYMAVGYALGHLPASLVAPTMIGQPVVTALLAIPLLGESLIPIQWVGGLSVLSGIYLVHRSRGTNG
jgi:drug/metabolite transporter (DMT)-like permease